MAEAQVLDITSRIIIALVGIGVFFLFLAWIKSKFDLERANKILYFFATLFLIGGSLIMGVPGFPIGLYLLMASIFVLSIIYLVIMTKVLGHVEEEYIEDYERITKNLPGWLIISSMVGLIQILKIRHRDRFLKKSLNMALIVAALTLVSIGLLFFYLINFGLINF